MIKVKNIEVVNSVMALKSILSKEIDIETSFEISLIVKEIQNVVDTYNESIQKLQDKYSKKDKNGKPIVVNGNQLEFGDGDKEKLEEEVEKLRNIEVSINADKIKLDNMKGIKVSPSVMTNLMFLIDK